MITRNNIKDIYRTFKNTPASIDELNLALLFDDTALHHDIMIDPDENRLIIGSIDPASPFHSLPLDRINAIVPFDEWIAVVMHSSIVFLNRKSGKVAIDIREVEPSFTDRMKRFFAAPRAC